MKSVLTHPFSASRRRRLHGFSLLEMLVGIGILSVLVLALYSMFDQTQKALRANVNQVDVMEGGRSVMDLLVRDVLRARSANLGTNYVYKPGTIKIADNGTIPPGTNLVVLRDALGPAGQIWNTQFGDQWRRESMLHDLFYLVELQPDQWVGAGLFVRPEEGETTFDGLGTLYRYEDRSPVSLRGARGGEQLAKLHTRFFGSEDDERNARIAYRTNAERSSRLLDGVVFFRVTPFGDQGQALDGTSNLSTNGYFPIPPGVIIGPTNRPPFDLDATVFTGRALPLALELELGILPPQYLEQFHALPETPPTLRRRFITNNAANILVFRQRIPLVTAPAPIP